MFGMFGMNASLLLSRLTSETPVPNTDTDTVKPFQLKHYDLAKQWSAPVGPAVSSLSVTFHSV